MKSTQDDLVAYVADKRNTESILKNIAKELSVFEVRTQKKRVSYFDTFEWRLYGANFLLKSCGGTLYLINSKQSRTVTTKAKSTQRFFWWEIDDAQFREKLKPLADIRALTEIVQVNTVSRDFDLLNKDRKTVVRLSVDNNTALGADTEKELLPIIRVKQMRGYEKAFKTITEALTRLGLQRLEDEKSCLQYTLAAIDREVLDYSSKFEIDLADDITIKETVSKICLFLVKAMERNLPGVLDDIDSEFLHDYRIAVRRTRSLLSQMKKLIPVEETLYFQNEFKWLGAITGPVRDMDVYLLEREQYKSMLPTQLHQGLDNFFKDLEKARVPKLQEMRDGLGSARYQNFMNAWARYLTGKDGTTWKMGGKECQPYATKMIRKRLTKILKDGGAITPDTPDAELHRLRIQGKKLRYLLEFFRSFFNAEEVDYFLKQLKKLQNNLGDFNDVSVQSEMLSGYIEDLSGRSKRSVQIAAAVGGLVTHLDNQHANIRQKFEGTFTAFSSEKNVSQFRSMLS